MNKAMIEKVLERPDASAGVDIPGADVTIVPRLAFVDGDGCKADWLDDVDEARVWVFEVSGRAHVSEVNNVVISGRKQSLYRDKLTGGGRTFRKHTLNLVPGTIVQAGITVQLKCGWKSVIAAVGVVPEIEEVDLNDDAPIEVPFFDDCAVTCGKSRTHQVSIAVQGVVPLRPEDAALISNFRHDIEVHGEDKVRAVLDLVTGE